MTSRYVQVQVLNIHTHIRVTDIHVWAHVTDTSLSQSFWYWWLKGINRPIHWYSCVQVQIINIHIWVTIFDIHVWLKVHVTSRQSKSKSLIMMFKDKLLTSPFLSPATVKVQICDTSAQTQDWIRQSHSHSKSKQTNWYSFLISVTVYTEELHILVRVCVRGINVHVTVQDKMINI